jgi:hypothetical protein
VCPKPSKDEPEEKRQNEVKQLQLDGLYSSGQVQLTSLSPPVLSPSADPNLSEL